MYNELIYGDVQVISDEPSSTTLNQEKTSQLYSKERSLLPLTFPWHLRELYATGILKTERKTSIFTPVLSCFSVLS